MVVIDNKGRLFGKVNVIDIILVALVILGVIVGVKFISDQLEPPEYEATYLILEVERVSSYILETVKEGDVGYYRGIPVLKIINFTAIPKSKEEGNYEVYLTFKVLSTNNGGDLKFADGQEIRAGAPIELITENSRFLGKIQKVSQDVGDLHLPDYKIVKKVIGVEVSNLVSDEIIRSIVKGGVNEYAGMNITNIVDYSAFPSVTREGYSQLYLIVEVLAISKDGRLISIENDNPSNDIKIGNYVNIHTDDGYFRGVIELVGDNTSEFREAYDKRVMGVSVISRGVYPEQGVNFVNVGDVELDASGEVIVKVVNREEISSSLVSVSDSGKVFVVKDPVRKDITLDADITVLKKGDDYFFKDELVKIGGKITFLPRNNLVEGVVIDIK